eukprot:1139819-Pelagomonas_calceolata.AAC.2
MAERAMRTRVAMDALKPSARAAIEGIRPGTYVRMRFTGMGAMGPMLACALQAHTQRCAGYDTFLAETSVTCVSYERVAFLDPQQNSLNGQSPCLHGMHMYLVSRQLPMTTVALAHYGMPMLAWHAGVSYELVAFHDPRRPLLIGGLGQDEDKLGVTKLRFKRHRYTPEHMHCIAAVFGPIAPQNTGVVAIQARDGSGDHAHARKWRISGTGVVLEVDADMRVVKKLKLAWCLELAHRRVEEAEAGERSLNELVPDVKGRLQDRRVLYVPGVGILACIMGRSFAGGS